MKFALFFGWMLASLCFASGQNTEKPCCPRAPDRESWEADVYYSLPREDGTYAWFYRASGEPYEPPANVFEAVGRMFAGVGMLRGGGTIVHHLASNKHATRYTALYKAIADKYGLSLNGGWNKITISTTYHYSKHPIEYHEFVLRGMKAADAMAAGNKAIFLEMFDKLVKQVVIKNPNLLNKTGW